jgi:hypothetical protein
MGLAVNVGVLVELAELDQEGLEAYRGYFSAVSDLLAEHGLPPHQEPEKLPPVQGRCGILGYPYSFLHHLRRVYAHLTADPDWVAEPAESDERASEDPLVEEVTMDMTSHLLCHSDAEGFYLPIDFREVLFDEQERVPGGMVGSSYRLREELVSIAPALGISLSGDELSDAQAQAINDDAEAQKGLWIERLVWLSLFEAARLSIAHKTAICFS